VFIVFYCVAYSLFFFFYNFLMAFVRLLLNCIVIVKVVGLGGGYITDALFVCLCARLLHN